MVKSVNLEVDELMLNAGYKGYLYHYTQEGNLGGWSKIARKYAKENGVKL